MSVIANFQKYYKDTDPALDLFDVIVSIYKWFYRNMWERRIQYMKTGKVIPIATSDFPGQDFGFMPMEAVFYTRSCFRTMYSNKKSAAISSEGCVIQLPDSVSEELSLTNAYSILWTGRQTHCTIPIAVNNEWGDVLYATCPIMPAEDGSTFMLDKSCPVYSLYDFSKIIIVSTLSAERRVLYNAVSGVFNDKKYVDVLSTYLQSLYKCEALSCDVKMDSHYNIISSKIVSEVTSIGKATEDLIGFPINWYNDLFDLPANTIVRALQYAYAEINRTWHNSRGRGERNRTHDCHVDDCTIYKANLVEYDPPVAMVRYKVINTDTTFKGPFVIEAELYTPERFQNSEILEKYETDPVRHVFVSVEKTDTWYYGRSLSTKPARANFEVYSDEIINLTYMNSCWLEWVINSKELGHWSIGGSQVDFAYAIRYLKKAMDHIKARELEEKKLLDAVDPSICANPEWQVQLSEWKIEKKVRVLTPYQAKRFAKYIEEKA